MTSAGRVLVLGGTQGTGALIVRRLLEEERPVRVVARDPSKARRAFGDSVEVVQGDVTQPETIPPALADVHDLVYTIGIPRRIASRRAVRATVLEGTLATLRAAEAAGLPGRFMYMSALGTTRWSVLGMLLDLAKGNTLQLRREVEAEIRRSPLAHTIVHAGILRNVGPGRAPIEISQNEYPLRPRYRIARSDVAEVFVRALDSPHTAGVTFDAVWARGDVPGLLETQFRHLEGD